MLLLAGLVVAVAAIGALAIGAMWRMVGPEVPFAAILVRGEALHAAHLHATSARRPRRMVEEGFALGDPDGAIAVEVRSDADGMRCVVEIEVAGLLEPSRWEGRLARAGRRYAIRPRLRWDSEGLLAQSGTGQATIVATISIDGGPATRVVRRVPIRPLRELPLSEPEAFGAFVNEDHPWIDGLLREALDVGVVESFAPIDGKSSERGIDQVFAVWSALAGRRLSYSNVAHTSREGSQHVRTFDETIRLRSANCADGSFVLTSIIARLGMPVAIVTVPGHMLVAFRPCLDCGWVGLETTLLGESRPPDLQDASFASSRLRFDATPHAEEWRRFEAALVAGTGQLPAHSSESRLLELSEIRDAGVMPLPTSSELGPLPPPPGKVR